MRAAGTSNASALQKAKNLFGARGEAGRVGTIKREAIVLLLYIVPASSWNGSLTPAWKIFLAMQLMSLWTSESFVDMHSFDIVTSLKLSVMRTSIEADAFCNCPSLRRVIMPGVKVVGAGAFNTCISLMNVECGELEVIEEMAFVWCR